MTPTDTTNQPRIWIRMNPLQSLVVQGPDDDGTITIEHAHLEELLTAAGFQPTTNWLPPSLRSVAFETDDATYGDLGRRAALVDWCRRCGVVGDIPHTSPCTDPINPADCDHESWSGVNQTPLDNPDKLWRCDVCGHETDPYVRARGRTVTCDDPLPHSYGLHAGSVEMDYQPDERHARYAWPVLSITDRPEPEVHHASGHHPTGTTCEQCQPDEPAKVCSVCGCIEPTRRLTRDPGVCPRCGHFVSLHRTP